MCLEIAEHSLEAFLEIALVFQTVVLLSPLAIKGNLIHTKINSSLWP